MVSEVRNRVVVSCLEPHTPGNCYQGEALTIVQTMSEQGRKRKIQGTSQRIYCSNIGMKQQREPQMNPVCGLGTEGHHY